MRWIIALLILSRLSLGHCQEQAILLNPYLGEVYMGMFHVKNDSALYSLINTDDLILSTITWNDYSDCIALLQKEDVVHTYGKTIPWEEENFTQQFIDWTRRWEEGEDPFSAFAIFSKKEEEKLNFIGYIVLSHGTVKGQADLEFVIDKSAWDQNYGQQAIIAILQGYTNFLSDLNYYVNLNDSNHVMASKLTSIHALSPVDEIQIHTALENAGMFPSNHEIINGIYLCHYEVSLNELEPYRDLTYFESFLEDEE